MGATCQCPCPLRSIDLYQKLSALTVPYLPVNASLLTHKELRIILAVNHTMSCWNPHGVLVSILCLHLFTLCVESNWVRYPRSPKILSRAGWAPTLSRTWNSSNSHFSSLSRCRACFTSSPKSALGNRGRFPRRVVLVVVN